ncbi:hypothetical protein [Candidatus Frankia nodulisporulans]|uniref:hypothetical protein n=1 Tax=Candidatus Frankia nodulisporulans TaxID=2060052 RepID=UPI0013D761B8|nr:hypothetical protein [Candidatus Frankia nodulisporulans]
MAARRFVVTGWAAACLLSAGLLAAGCDGTSTADAAAADRDAQTFASSTASAGSTSGTGSDAEQIREASGTRFDCPSPQRNPRIPTNATCVNVAISDLDGDGRPDRLLVFERTPPGGGRALLARAILATGQESEVALDSQLDAGDSLHPTILQTIDLNGEPGDEALVAVGYGASTADAEILTILDSRLTAVQDGAGARFPLLIGASAAGGDGYRCVARTGTTKPSLLVNHVEVDGAAGTWTVTRLLYGWQGPRLAELQQSTSSQPGQPTEAQLDALSYGALTCAKPYPAAS